MLKNSRRNTHFLFIRKDLFTLNCSFRWELRMARRSQGLRAEQSFKERFVSLRQPRLTHGRVLVELRSKQLLMSVGDSRRGGRRLTDAEVTFSVFVMLKIVKGHAQINEEEVICLPNKVIHPVNVCDLFGNALRHEKRAKFLGISPNVEKFTC